MASSTETPVLRSWVEHTLGLALLAAIGAAFGTGTAHAVVASLVEIVNPTTSPVPTLNVTGPGRVSYQSTINNAGNCSGGSCAFSFPSVPDGHRVVVQRINGYVQFNASPSYVEVQVGTGAFGANFLSAFFVSAPAGVFSTVIDQPALFYVDASGVVRIAITGQGTTFAGASAAQFLTLTGYELDCTVAACAGIATQ